MASKTNARISSRGTATSSCDDQTAQPERGANGRQPFSSSRIRESVAAASRGSRLMLVVVYAPSENRCRAAEGGWDSSLRAFVLSGLGCIPTHPGVRSQIIRGCNQVSHLESSPGRPGAGSRLAGQLHSVFSSASADILACDPCARASFRGTHPPRLPPRGRGSLAKLLGRHLLAVLPLGARYRSNSRVEATGARPDRTSTERMGRFLMTATNHSIQRMRASRLCRRQFERRWRLAGTADADR